MTFTALQRFLLCSKAHCPLVCKHWRGCDPALSAAEAQEERERLQTVQELFNYDWDIFPKHIAVSMEQLSYQALREAGLVLKRTDLPSAERSHLLHILKRRAAGYEQLSCIAVAMRRCRQELRWTQEDRLLIFEGHR